MRAPQQQPDRQLCHCAQWRFTEGVNQDNYNAVSNVNGTLPVTTRPSSGGGSSNSGNKTESTKNPDGSQEVVETKKDGNVVSLATLSQSAVEAAQEKGEAVTLPMPEVSVTVDLPVDGSVKVEISVENVTPDTAMTCAMIVTVLDRFEGVDTTTGDIWYEAEQQWAVALCRQPQCLQRPERLYRRRYGVPTRSRPLPGRWSRVSSAAPRPLLLVHRALLPEPRWRPS